MDHRILQTTRIGDTAVILRLERWELSFKAGQYVSVGLQGGHEKRDYSLYSATHDDFLELLIRKVAGGELSSLLSASEVGDILELDGPFGEFALPEEARNSRLLFVATGTGIAPFRSMVASEPGLDYLLLHGVPTREQLYGAESFAGDRHIGCLSRDRSGQFHGRVTEFLKQSRVDSFDYFLLCGSSEMIFDVFKILRSQEIPRQRILTEIYF